MNAVIETKNLTKWYGRARGIIDVNLTVSEGDIFGFIGPNGAGKSTTIRTLLSLIHKTSGEARIFGLDCEKDRVKILSDVGYLPGDVYYYDNMRAFDLLNYSAGFYKKDCSPRIKELCDILNIDLSAKIEDMSLGNRKKVGIAQGLLHSPRLIILDEPTGGLDPLMQKTFYNLLKDENKRGATVLFSSHVLSEVQRICDRVSIIKEGRIIDTQKISDIKQNSYKKVRLSVKDGWVPDDFSLPGAADIQIRDNVITFIYKGDCNLLLSEIGRYALADINIAEPSLDEIFMHYYTD